MKLIEYIFSYFVFMKNFLMLLWGLYQVSNRFITLLCMVGNNPVAPGSRQTVVSLCNMFLDRMSAFYALLNSLRWQI